jgi:hypothetical protein
LFLFGFNYYKQDKDENFFTKEIDKDDSINPITNDIVKNFNIDSKKIKKITNGYQYNLILIEGFYIITISIKI